MELNQLRYFLCVARLENITRASEELHITQPNLSRSIARLEEELGAELFERSKRRLKLNRQGEMFRDAVERAFKELDGAAQSIRDANSDGSVTLTLASSTTIRTPGVMENLLLNNHNLRLEQFICKAEDIPGLVRSKKADIGICLNALDDPDIDYLILAEVEIHLIIGLNSKYADKSDISLEELKDDYFICNENGYGRQLTDALCMKSGFVPKKKYVGADDIIVGTMLETADVVSFMPVTRFSSKELENAEMTRLVRLDGGGHRETIKLYFSREAALPPHVEKFISDLHNTISDA